MTSIQPYQKLSSRIIKIHGFNPGPKTLAGNNIYLLGTTNKRILLDTGEKNNPKFISSLKQVLEKNNAKIDKILLTHFHPDHIGGVNNILELDDSKYISKNLSDNVYKAEISDYYENCRTINLPEKMVKNPLLSEFRGLLSETGSPSSDIQKSDFDFRYNAIKPNQIFSEGDLGLTLKSIFSPGHAVDHICFYLEEENSLFTGDNILGGSSSVVEDLAVYLESLKIMKNLSNEETILYPAHGKIENYQTFEKYLNHRKSRINQCRDFFNKNKGQILTPQNFVDAIYVPAGLDEKLYLPACGNVLSCLIKMAVDGEILRVEEDGP